MYYEVGVNQHNERETLCTNSKLLHCTTVHSPGKAFHIDAFYDSCLMHTKIAHMSNEGSKYLWKITKNTLLCPCLRFILLNKYVFNSKVSKWPEKSFFCWWTAVWKKIFEVKLMLLFTPYYVYEHARLQKISGFSSLLALIETT